MYFDQGNIQCWKDQCEEYRRELTELKAELAAMKDDRRFKAACAVLNGLYTNQYYMERWSKKEDDVVLAVETADALLAELERTKKEEG